MKSPGSFKTAGAFFIIAGECAVFSTILDFSNHKWGKSHPKSPFGHQIIFTSARIMVYFLFTPQN